MKIIKVAKIIDERNIVLNCGDNDSISIGDKFKIFSKKTTVVLDPDSGETIGEIKLIKAKVEAVTVYDKMCVCQNIYDTFKLSAIAGLNSISFGRAQLNVDPSQISGGLETEIDEMIQIGDEAEKYD